MNGCTSLSSQQVQKSSHQPPFTVVACRQHTRPRLNCWRGDAGAYHIKCQRLCWYQQEPSELGQTPPQLAGHSLGNSLQEATILLRTVSRLHSKWRTKTVSRLKEGKVEAFSDFSYGKSKTAGVWADLASTTWAGGGTGSTASCIYAP